MRKFEYKYIIDEKNKVVVALSTFAKQKVRGVAKCSPNDDFDVEKGKKLAAARCSLKIAMKRMRRAEMCHICSTNNLNFWVQENARMEQYELDAIDGVKKAVEELSSIENSI